MNKRSRSPEDESPAKFQRGDFAARRGHFRAELENLNTQFARWVEQQKTTNLHLPWSGGLEDYMDHINDLLRTYKDVVESGKGFGPAFTTTSQGLAVNDGPGSSTAAAQTPHAAGSPGANLAQASTGLNSFTQPGRTAQAAAPQLNFGVGSNTATASQPAQPTFTFGNTAAAAADGTSVTAGLGGTAQGRPVFPSLMMSAPVSVAATAASAAASLPPATAASLTFGAPASSVPAASGPAQTQAFGFGTQPAASASISSAPSPVGSGAAAGLQPFAFGASASSTTDLQPANKPSSMPPASSTFSFGAAAAPAPASSSAGFTFGTAAATFAEPAPTTLGNTSASVFGSSTAFNGSTFKGSTLLPSNGTAAPATFSFFPAQAGTGGGTNESQAEGEDDDGAPDTVEDDFTKAEMKVQVDEKALLRIQPCAVQKKTGDTWESVGKGVLTIRKTEEGRPFLTLSTEAGRAIVTHYIYKHTSFTVKPAGKNAAVVMSLNRDLYLFKMVKGREEEMTRVLEAVRAELS